jgi:hypothetical protein
MVRLSVAGPDDLIFGPLAESRLLGARRPALGEHFSDIPDAEEAGFLFYCSLVGLEREVDLLLSALLSHGQTAPFARLRVRRDRVPGKPPVGVTPVLIDAPGRSGSTWLTCLLGRHPLGVTYRSFEREPRVAGYWTEVFRAVSGPTGYSRATDPEEVDSADWWIAERQWLPQVDVSRDPHLDHWLNSESVEEIASFCRGRIEGFYRSVARDEGKDRLEFFAERAVSPRVTAVVRELFPQSAVLSLIRDPRDILASRIAFNRQTGRQQFGRSAAADDEEYVRTHFAREMKHLVRKLDRAAERGLLIRYEELIERPKEVLGQVFKFLAVDARPETVSTILEDARSLLPERQHSHRTARKPRTSIGRWRQDLSESLVTACEQELGDVMARLDY